jgi:hypothetical protein
MVMDHFAPLIPLKPVYEPAVRPLDGFVNLPTMKGCDADYIIVSRAEVERLKALIESFRKAVEAAMIVDSLTGQPDCVDPEKQRLQDRVDELEKQLQNVKSAISG